MKKIPLKYPVTHNGATIKALTMRRPKVSDQKAAERSAPDAASRETTLFANLCEVDPAVIDDLDMLDYAELQETYSGFLSRRKPNSGPPAGS